MQRDDGGSAFPSTPLGDDGKPGGAHRFGMSLRDWYAGQALSSIQLRCWDDLQQAGEKTAVAAWASLAFVVADAMLAARSPAPEEAEADPRDELLREAVQVIEQMRVRLHPCDNLLPSEAATLAKIQKELGDG